MTADDNPGEQLPVRSRGRAMDPFEEMERMFEDVFGRRMPSLRPSTGELAPFEGRQPRVNVQDREADIRITAELPGVGKDDVDVSVSDNAVTIKASTREEKEEGEPEGEFFRREIASGSFSRTVPLPGDVDADKAKASFDNGVLELTLPKVEGSRRRQIPVE